MKRFHFPFQTVLRLKRQQRRMAEVQQAQARRHLELARQKMQQLRQAMDRAAQQMAEQISQGGRACNWLARQQQVAGLMIRQREAQAACGRAARALSQANRRWQRINAEVQALELLREQQWRQHRRQGRQEQQERLDQLVLGRWQRHGPPAGDQAVAQQQQRPETGQQMPENA